MSQSLVGADGATVAAAGTGTPAMLDTVFQTGPGQTMSVESPPAGFSPATASPGELSLTGFSSLPASLQQQVIAAHMRFVPADAMCQLPGQEFTGSSYSGNWAGTALYDKGSNKFVQVGASWTVPYFSTRCGRTASSPVWTGLGGYPVGADELMQAGIQDQGNGDAYAWWEVIHLRNYPGSAVRPTDFPVFQGDKVTVFTRYLGSRDEFYFFDWTTHLVWNPQPPSIYGHKPSYFYDGQSAEVMGERLAAPYADAGAIPVTAINFNTLGTFASYSKYLSTVTMTRNGKASGAVIAEPTQLATYKVYLGLQSSRFDITWVRCS